MNNSQPVQVSSPTIFSLAKEVSEKANCILNRAGSIADCLGGQQPETAKTENPPAPNDLHSVLQRLNTTLMYIEGELYRSERVIGLTPEPNPELCAKTQKARY